MIQEADSSAQGEAGAGDARTRLLEAASVVFAERGYEAASVREITSRAGTNLNSINYYFGGKQGLYVAVMRYQVERSARSHPAPAAHCPRLDAEAQLRETILGLLRWFLDPDSLLPRLSAHELLNPSPALERISQEPPGAPALRGVVTAVLGDRATPALVDRCTRSVLAQCVYYMFMREVLPRIEKDYRYDEATLRRYAQHIAEFSVGGMRACAQPRSTAATRRSH